MITSKCLVCIVGQSIYLSRGPVAWAVTRRLLLRNCRRPSDTCIESISSTMRSMQRSNKPFKVENARCIAAYKMYNISVTNIALATGHVFRQCNCKRLSCIHDNSNTRVCLSDSTYSMVAGIFFGGQFYTPAGFRSDDKDGATANRTCD